jgi:hypothetical protein
MTRYHWGRTHANLLKQTTTFSVSAFDGVTSHSLHLVASDDRRHSLELTRVVDKTVSLQAHRDRGRPGSRKLPVCLKPRSLCHASHMMHPPAVLPSVTPGPSLQVFLDLPQRARAALKDILCSSKSLPQNGETFFVKDLNH